jgi:hypothetical protein
LSFERLLSAHVGRHHEHGLNLEDDYGTEPGRESIDAVVLLGRC